MNNAVFVDTVAWIALINRNDSLYMQAHEVMNQLRNDNSQLITTDFVIMEIANGMSKPPFRSLSISFINNLRLLNAVRIIPVSSVIFNEGWRLYSKRTDKEWSLTDCISFEIMNKENISKAFTSDHHFEQAGFEKLL